MSRRKLWAAAAALAVASAGIAMPALAAPTGGSGGPLTDQTGLSYSDGTRSSTYHRYAAGLDWSKPVGLMVHLDGSDEYGLANPSSSYALAGSNGLIAVAKRNNMLLVTPRAPGGGIDWYNTTGGVNPDQKADWLLSFLLVVESDYNVDTDRVSLSGYSSGSQGLARWFLPKGYAQQIMDDGVITFITCGGNPAGRAAAMNPAFLENVHLHWNASSGDTVCPVDSAWSTNGGYNYYTGLGFDTSRNILSGGGHSRSGQFGAIVESQIEAHVPAGSATPTPTPIPTPGPTPTPTPTPTPEPEPTDPAPSVPVTVDATETGVTLTADVPGEQAEATYFRLSNPTTGRTTYLYNTGARPAAVTFRSLGTLGDEWNYAVYAGPSTNQAPLATGSFRTWTQPPPPPIPGDVNGDRIVNFDDLKALSESRPDDAELADIAANWGSN